MRIVLLPKLESPQYWQKIDEKHVLILWFYLNSGLLSMFLIAYFNILLLSISNYIYIYIYIYIKYKSKRYLYKYMLNKRSEIISQCRHKNKYRLKTLASSMTSVDRAVIKLKIVK